MKRHSTLALKHHLLLYLVSGFALSFMLAACASRNTKIQNQSLPIATQDKYQAALVDSQQVTAAKVAKNLIPIRKSNGQLVWKDYKSEKAKVLMAHWTGSNEYKEHLHKTFQIHHEVWVTAVPELREKCAELASDTTDLRLRLKQLLGLPKSKEYNAVAEFWADPKDVFRPCADPEIDDQVCDLQLSEKASPAHREWYMKQVQARQSPEGYPWTALGYTYDWSEDSSKHQGLSEFVVKPEAEITVEAVYSTDEYCHLHQ